MAELEEDFVAELIMSYIRIRFIFQRMQLPEGCETALAFAEKNLFRVYSDRKNWRTIKMKSSGSIDGLSDTYLSTLLSVLRMGKALNDMREKENKARVNYVKEAMLRDQKEKASQQQGPKTNPKW